MNYTPETNPSTNRYDMYGGVISFDKEIVCSHRYSVNEFDIFACDLASNKFIKTTIKPINTSLAHK